MANQGTPGGSDMDYNGTVERNFQNCEESISGHEVLLENMILIQDSNELRYSNVEEKLSRLEQTLSQVLSLLSPSTTGITSSDSITTGITNSANITTGIKNSANITTGIKNCGKITSGTTISFTPMKIFGEEEKNNTSFTPMKIIGEEEKQEYQRPNYRHQYSNSYRYAEDTPIHNIGTTSRDEPSSTYFQRSFSNQTNL
jgi:hypothetical protein